MSRSHREVQKEANHERCRDFVRFIQQATAEGLGTYVAYEHDGWLVVASWDGSEMNDLLRDLIAADNDKPQTITAVDAQETAV